MINIFRKKPKQLAGDHKAFKYIQYATGEIVLVVIGILIALSINNWNNVRLKNKEAVSLSKRLLIETKKNKKQLKEEIDKLKEIRDETLSLLNLIGENYTTKNEKLVDSLVYGVIATPLLEFNSSTLDEALNTGQVSILPSDSLRLMLYDIPKQIVKINNYEEEMKRDIETNLIPFLYQEFSMRQMDERFSNVLIVNKKSSLKYFDNRVVLSKQPFENMIDNKFFITESILIGYNDLLRVFDNTILILEKELNLERF